MKSITNSYKENVKLFGRELDSKITYELNGETIELGSEELNSVTPHYEASILKSVMKQLDIDSNVEIPIGITLNYQFGIKVNNNYEYINYGNYIVYETEKQEDTNSWKITCYDKMLLTMKDYVAMSITYPITIRDYINAICIFNGLTFKNANDEFANYNKEIPTERYLNNSGQSLDYTFRSVLDELAQVTASTICINEDDDELEIRYINETNDTIDEEYLKDINVNFGEKYGPVNSIVLSRSAESDNIYLRDEESIEENGLCEIKIIDNQIMNFNDRDQYLEDILEKLNGLEYYVNDFSSTGITYYELCDNYNIQIGENTYNCIMLNDETNITQGLEELIHTDKLEETTTDYKAADKTDRRINQTWIIANKNTGDITALTSRTTTLEDEMGNRYTKTETNELVQNASTGITNTFSEAGGNNIFRNTGLWFGPDTTTEEKQESSTDGKIEIDDGADNTLNDLKLYGNTEQETTSGKNLLNLSDITTTTINGVTFTPVFENNMLQYINVNGTATARVFYNLGRTTLADGNYRTTGCPRGGSNSTYAIYNTGNYQNDTGNGQVFKNGSELRIFIENGYTANNLKFKPMISSDTSLTYDDYEPYIVGKPSPGIPSEIETVTGRQEISVSGKNLFDKNKTLDNYFYTSSGTTSTYSKAQFVNQKVIASQKDIVISYKHRYDQQGGSSINAYVRFVQYDKNGNFISRIMIQNNNATATLDNNTAYFILCVDNGNDAYFEDLQVEYGTTATEYETFKGGSYEINLGKNLFDKDTAVAGTFYNVSNGSIISSNAWSQSEYIPYNENTYFAISSTYLENNASFELTQFDENKNWIKSRQFSLTTGSWVEKTENGTKYVKLGFRNDRGVELNFQLEKGSQATIYSAYKTPIELCKIGDYRDYIYKSNGKWYKHKVIGKIVLDGSESGWTSTGTNVFRSATNIINVSQQSNARLGLCDYYKFNPVINNVTGTLKGGEFAIQFGTDNIGTLFFKNSNITTVSDWQTYLSNNNVIVYYILATPVEEEITDSELIEQLESIKTIDGYNLIILDSKDVDTEIDITYLINFTSYEFWNGDLDKIKEEKAANLNALLLQHGTVYQEQQIPNGSYTISFKYKKLINLAEVKCIINDVEYELTATEDTEFEQVIEVNTQNIKVSFVSDRQNSCEIYDLMVNAGKVKLAYSQNQNETTTDTVNISKGITITSSNTETTFKANADGIRTLDRSGNELTKFTDTGMTTKKMIVEDTSQVVGILIQQVGDQTWFTKL